MNYYSTNNKSHQVSLKDAVLKGLAPDKGLYMPESIPVLSKAFFDSLPEKSFQEIAFEVAHAIVQNDVPADELKRIVNHTITFDAPLVEIEKNIFSLELFHGPTLAFKDFGARFMSQLLGYFAREEKREIVILVATSGDTGSAVANGFLGVPGTKVVVLYPSGKVSDIQEKQFTTLGQNITALEIDGSFDDCQRLVKQAFLDEELTQKFFLTSANSINIVRLIPQSFYYFYAWSRLKDKSNVVFAVPSGNFGNLTAGLIAKRMGLPINHFIASTNRNDIVPEYLQTGAFNPRPSQSTISNAMDVGNPSNFARMMDLYNNDLNTIKSGITGYTFSDEETKQVMQDVYKKSNYVLDPHGAVGYLGLKKYFSENNDATGVFLETAHPAKFLEVVEDVLKQKITIPEKLVAFQHKK
ncbi:MAG TPA: threonine synthase, partial [Cyclobacteriaceae bacterium]|nr:threonine synthase [Cyclobacteriaceae bacterium]